MVKSTGDQSVDVILKGVAQLPRFITEWRRETDQYLASLIPGSQRQQNGDDNALLELATSFFQCDMCTEPISYPRILMHDCFLRSSGPIAGSNHNAQGSGIQKERKGASQGIPREPRPFRTITADTVWPSLSEKYGAGMHPGRAGVAFYKEASQSARRIILSCDENPDTITFAEMDQKDVRVQCLHCSSAMTGKLVMRWTIAVSRDIILVFIMLFTRSRSFTISKNIRKNHHISCIGDWLILRRIWGKSKEKRHVRRIGPTRLTVVIVINQ